MLPEPWYEAETMDVVIGQGFLQVTPLQLARLYMAIANEGNLYPIQLVREIGSPSGDVVVNIDQNRFQRIEAKPSTWRALKDGLRHVLQWQRGTAYQRVRRSALRPGGKDGLGPNGSAAHGWFAGFAPALILRSSSSSLPSMAKAGPARRLSPGRSWRLLRAHRGRIRPAAGE